MKENLPNPEKPELPISLEEAKRARVKKVTKTKAMENLIRAIYGDFDKIRETPKSHDEEPPAEYFIAIDVGKEQHEANQRREKIKIVGGENNLGDENEEMQPSESTDKTDDSTSEATILPFPKKS